MYVYVIGNYAGFFAIMAVCMLFAVLTARTKFSALFLIGGAIIQIIAIASKEKSTPFAVDTTVDWIIFFSLLAVSVILVFVRRAKH